jgi:hypothetical protein
VAQVATVRTGATAGNVLAALLDAGAPPSGVRMLAAQSAVETAGWTAMASWNLGNVTALGDQPYMLQGSNPLHFRAYDSLDEGARDFVSFLGRRGLLPYAAHGDLDGYVARLEATCYLGCVGSVGVDGRTVPASDYDAYRAGIASWMSKLANVAPVRGAIGWGPWALAGGLGLLALGLVKR